MITINDFLNKIKWNKNLNPDEYSIFYIDRLTKDLIEIRYNDIKRIKKGFIIIEKDGKEVNIPLHRIKRAKRDNKLVWERE